MLDILWGILKFLFSLFNALPEEAKENVFKEVQDEFEPLFREFFRANSGEK